MTDDKLGPPPVEPLSDVAWARVERGLWARMDTATAPEPVRSRRWWWLAVPVAAAATIAVVLVTRGDDRTEVVAEARPETTDVRVVAPATAATTATFDDAHIELAPASAVVLRRDRPVTVLERGAAWFSVAPRMDRAPFTVQAGDATVRVLGTRFRVARSDERITVEVDHGRVEVQFRDRVQFLGSRQTWSSEEPERVTLLEQHAAATPTPEPAVEPARSEPPAQPRAPAVTKPAKPTVATAKQPDPDQLKFEQLSVLEKKNPQAAMAGYLEISGRGSKWAANALYAAGRLAADRGDPRAATLLTVYLHRFPSGANVVDARALLARLPAPRGAPR